MVSCDRTLATGLSFLGKDGTRTPPGLQSGVAGARGKDRGGGANGSGLLGGGGGRRCPPPPPQAADRFPGARSFSLLRPPHGASSPRGGGANPPQPLPP